MVVEQVSFEIPEATHAKLTSGDLVRYGGIIRDNAGHIVEHLQEIVPPRGPSSSLTQTPPSRKGPLVIISVVATAVVGGAVWMYQRSQDRQSRLEPFRLAIAEYVKAIESQSMNMLVVDDLMAALKFLDPKLAKRLPAESIDLIISYTREFATANGFEPVEDDAEVKSAIDLIPYLQQQLDILQNRG